MRMNLLAVQAAMAEYRETVTAPDEPELLFDPLTEPMNDPEDNTLALEAEEFVEMTNQYGYPDKYHYTDLSSKNPTPVCRNCFCYKHANRGEGLICDNCNHQMEMDHLLD